MTNGETLSPGAVTAADAIPRWLADAPDALPELPMGDEAAGARAALEGDALYLLPQLGGLRVEGRDAVSFLQGQLSSDVAALNPGRAQLSSYNSPKGRVLAVFVSARDKEGIALETRAGLVPALEKRLRMFVLRAQVQLRDTSASAPLLGFSGPTAARTLEALGLPAPQAEWEIAVQDSVTVMRRPGSIARYSLQAAPARLVQLWRALAPHAPACGPAAWRLLEILAGQPSVVAATQDQFVAQMLNLDALGGISFSKGCYTGQEVVARLHYLGKLKRRMFLAQAAQAPVPGTAIHLAQGDVQAVGEVVDAAPHPAQGAALLAVLQVQHAGQALRLGSPQGVALQVLSEKSAD